MKNLKIGNKVVFLNSKISFWSFCLILSINFGISSSFAAISTHLKTSFSGACSNNESWKWSIEDQKTSSKWIHEFEMSLTQAGSKIRGFSEALALRKLAKSERDLAFAEYWMSRNLADSGQIHLAEKGLNAILGRETNLQTGIFQLAALGCLSQLHRKYPSLGMATQLLPRIQKLNEILPKIVDETEPFKPAIWEIALLISLGKTNPLPESLVLLRNSGIYESLSLAALHSSQDRFTEALQDLQAFFSNANSHEFSKPFMDQAHLLYGRAAYAEGRYPEAIVHFQAVGLRSNERIHALEELSWAYLLAEKYREAAGTAIGLQSGAMKQTFAPEALMVMAMALNEMCRFPDSMNVIHSFRRNYRDSFFWLKSETAKTESSRMNYYKSAIEFTKGLNYSKVPSSIASEWIRSSLFLSNQERINLIFKEKKLADQLSQGGKAEQKSSTMRLLNEVRALQKKFKLAKIRNKPNEGLPQDLMSELDHLRSEIIHHQHLKNAAPIWRKILANYQTKVPSIQKEMVAGINQEINRLNKRMFAQLEEILENNELIEVEILNGASEDLIWQNAHPDWKQVVSKMKQTNNQSSEDKVWNWGTTQGGLDGRSEIWEDEIGSLTADLNDNCESKDKYLSVETAAVSQ